MPIYEYKCTNCGRLYDELRSYEGSATSKCVDCGSLAEKVFSSPAKPRGSKAADKSFQNKKGCSTIFSFSSSGDIGIISNCPAINCAMEKLTNEKREKTSDLIRKSYNSGTN